MSAAHAVFPEKKVSGTSKPPLKAVRVPAISQLRRMLDELESKLAAPSDEERPDAASDSVDDDLGEWLEDVQELISSFRPSPGSSSVPRKNPKRNGGAGRGSSLRIQLKLSPDLVRVLQTVRETGVRASELVESVLWTSPRVRDTARLTGIPRPPRKRCG